MAVVRDDENGLDDPGLPDGLGQFIDGLVVELHPGLEGIRLELLDIEFGVAFLLDDPEFLRDERAETFSQCFFHHLRSISSARLR